MKTCRSCKLEKPLTDFYREKTSPDGLRQTCKACKNASTMRWRAKNREHYNTYTRNRNKIFYRRNRLYRYEISIADHDRMLERQNGLCAICGARPPKNKPLVVDHNHETKKVRGLLCYTCNRSIASYDNEDLHRKILAYLQSHK